MKRSEYRLFRDSQRLIQEALNQEAESRESYVRRVAAGDPELLEYALVQLRYSIAEVSNGGHGSSQGSAPKAAPSNMEDRLRREPRLDRERYSRRERLDEGGMGEIWLVEDNLLQRKVALKVPKLGMGRGTDDAPVHLFLHEARITSRFDHPDIVPVHDLGLDGEGRPGMLMRHVAGTTLRKTVELHRVGQGDWSIQRSLEVVLRLCDTLAYAHSRGVVHRDVKPENVMIGTFGEVYLLDWGLAKDEHPPQGGPEVKANLKRAGTDGYRAPEQAEGRTVTAQADVYSLGVVLRELVASVGSSGPSGAAPADKLHERRRGRLPSWLQGAVPGVRPEIMAIIERATAHLPKNRYPSTVDLAEDLRAFLSSRVVRAHRAGPTYRVRLWVQRNRALAAVLAFVTPVLLLGAVALLWFADEVAADRAARELMEREPGLAVTYGSLADLEAAMRDYGRVTGSVELTSLFETPFAGAGAKHAWGVRRRLDAVQKLHRAHRDFGAERWRQVLRELAADRRFAGWLPADEPDLVPIGVDADSGLHCFWHPATGDEPERAADGRFTIREATGLVFVLLPPGRYRRGSFPFGGGPARTEIESQAIARDWHLYAFEQDGDEAPFEQSVQPGFFGKWEVTQAQWLRMTGTDPSAHSGYRGGSPLAGIAVGTLHPVENVTHQQAAACLRMFGFELPSEAAWEYGCRAGTDSRWWFGDDPKAALSLPSGRRVLFANVSDLALFRLRPTLVPEGFAAPFDDGYAHHAPVDALAPNAFGLVGMAGNVWELCHDVYDPHVAARESGKVEVPPPPDPRLRVVRGGGWQSPIREASSSDRWCKFEYQSSPDVGLRAFKPARRR
jgi:formylglycine-generating enzyme required for sulfatase activity